MRRRAWGVSLVVIGLSIASLGVLTVLAARGEWAEAREACAGTGDDWCGGLRTYLAALAMALAPFATVLGMLVLTIGLTLVLLPSSGRPPSPPGFLERPPPLR